MSSETTPFDVFGFLEDLVDEAELERIMALTPEERDAELVAEGVDLEEAREMGRRMREDGKDVKP